MTTRWEGKDKLSEREKAVNRQHVPKPVSRYCECKRSIFKPDMDRIWRCQMCGKLPRIESGK